MSIVREHIVYLNSRNGVKLGSDTDYMKFDLLEKYTLQKDTNWFEVQLLQLTIPYSFKQIPKPITVSGFYTHTGINTPFTFSIPPGNYSMLDLNDTFKQLLLQVSHPHNWEFTITYDGNTGFNTYSFSSSQTFSFTFSHNEYWERAGFSQTDTLVFSNTVSLTSTKHCCVNRINSIVLRSDNLFQSKNQENLTDEENVIELSDIIAKIFLYSSYNSWIHYDAGPQNPPVRILNNTISNIQLYLSSNVSFTLPLGGIDWTCSLKFTEKEQIIKDSSSENYKNLSSDAMKTLADIRESIISELQGERSSLVPQ